MWITKQFSKSLTVLTIAWLPIVYGILSLFDGLMNPSRLWNDLSIWMSIIIIALGLILLGADYLTTKFIKNKFKLTIVQLIILSIPTLLFCSLFV